MAFPGAAPDPTLADINITPLVDVMLVLLVIFMVTSPLLTRSLPFDLPSAPLDHRRIERDAVTLAIDADGLARWNGNPLPARAIQALLLQEAAQEQPALLRLEVDEDTEYRHVAALLGQARHAGLTRIAMPY